MIRADFAFGEKEVILSEGNNKSKYTYTDSFYGNSAPDKNLELDSIDVSVKVSTDDLKKVLMRQLIN